MADGNSFGPDSSCGEIQILLSGMTSFHRETHLVHLIHLIHLILMFHLSQLKVCERCDVHSHGSVFKIHQTTDTDNPFFIFGPAQGNQISISHDQSVGGIFFCVPPPPKESKVEES